MTPNYLEPRKVKGICVISVYESQISLRFALCPGVFELQTILRQGHGMNQSYLEPYKVKLPYIRITSIPGSQISLRFAPRPGVFELQAILRQRHGMNQIDLEPYKVKLPYICRATVLKSRLPIPFALRPAVFELQAILRQVHRITPIDLEHYKIKGTSHKCHYCPRFALRPAVSRYIFYNSPFTTFTLRSHEISITCNM